MADEIEKVFLVDGVMGRAGEQRQRNEQHAGGHGERQKAAQRLLPPAQRRLRAKERLHAAAQRRLAAGHVRRAKGLAPPGRGQGSHGGGVGAALLHRAAKVSLAVAGIFLAHARLAAQQPHRRHEPEKRPQREPRQAPHGGISAVDVYQLVAEDGVERFIVVVLAVEQQQAHAEYQTHRPGKAGHHHHLARAVFVGLFAEYAVLEGTADIHQRPLDALRRRVALLVHAPPEAQQARHLPEQAEDEADQPDPSEHLQRPRPPPRRQFPQARTGVDGKSHVDETVGGVAMAKEQVRKHMKGHVEEQFPDREAEYPAPRAGIEPALALAVKKQQQAEAQARAQRDGDKVAHGVSPFCAALTPPPATIRPTRGPPARRPPSPGRARPRPAGRAA